MSLISENIQRYAENRGKYINNKGCHSMTPCNPQIVQNETIFGI
jgi:hypothetical protein